MRGPLRLRALVKRALARTLAGSGVLGARERLGAPGLTLLMYHRVLPLSDALVSPFGGMILPRDEFGAQIDHLARHYHVLPLAEAVAGLGEGKLPRRAVALTFDDGYRDNYEHAYPVLLRHGLPATFFVVTDVLDGRLGLWWDEVARSLSAAAGRLDAAALEGLEPPLRDAVLGARPDSPASIAAVVRQLNRAGRSTRQSAVAAIRRACRDAPLPGERLMMSWEEAREMAANGMEFGTHTRTHAFLDEIDREEAQEEIAGSMARIREVLGQPARHLAYPRGRVAPAHYETLRRCGIEAALTTQMGTNRPGADLFALLRMDPGFARLDSGFDAAVFDAEIAGAFGVKGRV